MLSYKAVRIWAGTEAAKKLVGWYFRNWASVLHQDGSLFDLKCATLVRVNNEFLVAFTEHNGYIVWLIADLAKYSSQPDNIMDVTLPE